MPSWLRRNLLLMVPVAVVQTVGYLLLNHVPLFPPRTLPLTPIDEAIPFLPWTVWPYFGLISSQATLPLLIRRRDVLVRLVLAYSLAIPTLFLIFLLWPTIYPRPPAPTGDGVSERVYRLLTAIDTPDCCCPSGHVVGPAIIFWSVWRDRQRGGVWLLAGFVVGVASILTTKQHYLWDLLAGLTLATATVLVARLAGPSPPAGTLASSPGPAQSVRS